MQMYVTQRKKKKRKKKKKGKKGKERKKTRDISTRRRQRVCDLRSAFASDCPFLRHEITR
jgi:hypothetical protein